MALLKRVRVLALGLFLQTPVILLVMGAILGRILLLSSLGLAVGIGVAAVTLLAWHIDRQVLEEQGFRW